MKNVLFEQKKDKIMK